MSRATTSPPDRRTESWNKPDEYPSEDEQHRWATRRAQFLTRIHDLSETRARCVAWSELGFSDSGIAQQLDLTESTVKNHREELEQQFGYGVGMSRTEFSIDFRLTDLPTLTSPYCPDCGQRQVIEAASADSTFNSISETIQSAIDNDDATHVCLACGAQLAPVES